MGFRGWYALVVALLFVSPVALLGQPVADVMTDGDDFHLDGPEGASMQGSVSPHDIGALLDGHFLENIGQAPHSDVAFYAVAEPLSVGLGTGFVEYALRDGDGAHGSVVRVRLDGADDAGPVGAEPMGHITSFLLGPDPAGWARGARSYRQVVYREAWPGIDISFGLAGGGLKYEFTVRSGADPADIRLVYEGASGLGVDPATGDLVVRTASGDLRDRAPWSYQVVDGQRLTVATAFSVDGDDAAVTFDVATFDHDLPLVIDPNISFSTYLGGSSEEYLWDMAVDDAGCAYVTGYTLSTNYPVTSGAYDGTIGGSKDIFVTKLSSDGSALEYSTFLGGSNQDEARSIAVDSNGSAYIGGVTLSTDYPVTSGANQTTHGGSVDIVVTKLVANGTDLEWSTYVGGSGGDFTFDIRVDSQGAAYVGGYSGGNFPTTSGAFDTTHNSRQDGVMLKLSADGSKLVYSTYIGGSWDDYIYGIAIDSSGNAYATGFTGSANTTFPVTPGAFCTTEVDGDDGFVLRLNASGTGLLWCGLISGSTSGTACWCVDVDQAGNAYVAGDTKVADLPVSNWSYDDTLNGTRDAFVAKIEVNGTYYSYMTYLGGDNWEYLFDIEVDGKGRAHVTGRTSSTGYPTTADAYDRTYNYGNDVVYSVLDASGSSLVYSTFVGTDDDEEGWGVHVDADGVVTIAGVTESDAFPTTSGAHCTTKPGNQDGFVLRLAPSLVPPWFGPDATPASASIGSQMTFSVNISDDTRVQNASVDYWYGTGQHYSRTMSRTAGTSKDGTWNATIYTYGSLDPLHYKFYATDEDGNSNNTSVRDVTLIDDRPPWIDDHTPWYNWPDGATTGDPFRFVANVSDGLGVSEVRIHYTLGSPPWLDVNVTMDPYGVWVNGNGMYIWNITVPSNATGSIDYELMATDTSDNTMVINGTAPVTDNDGPELGPDRSDAGATTGDPFLLSVDAVDNLGVVGVWANYRLGLGPARNDSMDPGTVDAGGNGTYVLNLTVPTDFTGTITYWFCAADMSWNWNATSAAQVESVDDDPPTLGPNKSHEGVDELILEVDANDNVGIAQVWVVYTYSGQAPVNVTMVPLTVGSNGNGTYGNVQLPVDPEEQVRIDYVFGTVDAAGHVATLSGRYMNIDPEPPEFGEHGVLGEPVKGWNVSIWVEVWDNLQLEDVRIVYSFGGESEVNASTIDEGDVFNITVPLPRWPAGDLLYRFEAVDIKGNWNRTEGFTLALENRAPQAATPITWEVTEGVAAVLDLAPLLSDANDEVDDLSLSTEAEGVTVDELRLGVLYDEWRADHDIEVTVSDGEDGTTFTVTIHVINVNDDPVITSTPPVEGSVGEGYSYQVEYTDEDAGDVHTFRLADAPEGMAVDGDGLVTWTPGEGQTGDHTVDLTLSDGTSVVHQTWTVTVTAPPVNRPPAFTNSPPRTHVAGAHYEWDAEAEDPDGDEVTFSLLSGPAGATMDSATGVLAWDPAADRRDASEDVNFSVRVSDGELDADMGFTVVLAYPANQAPVITSGLVQQNVSKETSIDLAPYMSDPDDPKEDLYWTAESTSDLFTFRLEGNVLVVEPVAGKEGAGTVTLRLYDPWGLVDTYELGVQVDTKERKVTEGWCGSLWWLLLILLVLALLVAYLTRERWMPRREPPEEERPGEGEAQG